VFRVTQGACATDGNCFTSPNFPANYDNDEYCTIVVDTDVSLVVQSFATEAGYDYLSVNDYYYAGSGVGLEGLVVRAGDIITWSSDYTVTDQGFSICSGGTCPSSAHAQRLILSCTKLLCVLSVGMVWNPQMLHLLLLLLLLLPLHLRFVLPLLLLLLLYLLVGTRPSMSLVFGVAPHVPLTMSIALVRPQTHAPCTGSMCGTGCVTGVREVATVEELTAALNDAALHYVRITQDLFLVQQIVFARTTPLVVEGACGGGTRGCKIAPFADNAAFTEIWGSSCSDWAGACALDSGYYISACPVPGAPAVGVDESTCEVGGLVSGSSDYSDYTSDGTCYFSKAHMDEVRSECPVSCAISNTDNYGSDTNSYDSDFDTSLTSPTSSKGEVARFRFFDVTLTLLEEEELSFINLTFTRGKAEVRLIRCGAPEPRTVLCAVPSEMGPFAALAGH
jgi:hypothetical protein